MNGAIFTPSLFGFFTWIATYFLYVSNVLPWNSAVIEVHIIFIVQIILFLLATLFFSKSYLNTKLKELSVSCKVPSVTLVLILQLIGFCGITKFILDFSPHLPDGFVGSLLGDSSQIRALGAEITSIGIQLSYFGWLAIGISFCYRKINWWLIFISLFQFIVNFIFIDRTRPIWILFTVFLCFVWTRNNLNGWRVFRSLFIVGIMFIILFVVVALWSGKTGEGVVDEHVNPLIGSLYLYITAGFAYFSHMLAVEIPGEFFIPDRVFAPIFTILSSLGLSTPPPAQILDFYEVPYFTNVGTALEPFYRDGGLLFLVLGMFIYSFGFNLFGLWLLKRNNAFAVYAWATLCFCNLIGSFTPKIGNFPVWFFIVLGVLPIFSFSSKSKLEACRQ